MSAPDFDAVGGELIEQSKRKRAAYGSNMETAPQVMRLLYPNGIRHEQMADALLIIRIVDKLTRIANGGGRFALGEDAWKDIAGYAMCALADGRAESAAR